jgi:tetratricopeptide (TPR) repeat protein
VVCWLLLVPIAGFAASGDEFYQRLYQRGMAHFAAGEYASAFTELRNAAFGFVEQVDEFETVQAYATIAAHRLGHDSDARDSLLRIASAEKIQPHFRSVRLPAELRAEVDTVAAALLTRQECTLLGVPTEVQDAAAAAKPPVAVPTPTKRPNVAVTAPRERGAADTDADPATTPTRQATPTPRPVAPQPQTVVPQPVNPAPQPVTPQPVAPTPQPVDPVPKPPAPVSPQPEPQPKQETVRAQPQPTAPVSTPQPDVKNADTSLAEAQHAVDNGDLSRARSIYGALLSGPNLSHLATLRLAEGLYRVHDFAGAARAFQRAGTLGRGEEPYHYYYAVALYEGGRYGEAKRELAASLPYISVTPDVARYRAKIEGAIE